MTDTDPNATRPEHLCLEEVIARLKREDPTKQVPVGFAAPHSYRGYYEELAFEVRRDITVGEMLAAAESADGVTFQGWKGGDYQMGGHSTCWLVVERGWSSGETVGALLLELMLAAGQAAS
jgi:hypothetical protein